MAEPTRSSAGVEVLAHELEKPLLDDRTYRVIKLPNQLEALIIHDPDTDKAAAAVDVNAGSFSDDEMMPGLAHAVEHVLFMGTEKYPGENDYNSFLSKYGGYSNAYTASTSTNYYFEISVSSTSNSTSTSTNTSQTNLPATKAQSPLHGALDRFSQFFVKPLFSEDTLDRELRAVDSENKKNLQSDVWRLQQLRRSLSSKQHPYQKFSTGNYETLHDDPIARGVKIRDEFIDFYDKQYSANRMKLAVLGKESLDELQSWVETMFSDVPNKDLPKLRWDGIPVYDQNDLLTLTCAKPVMDQRSLEITFPYPDEDEFWDSNPASYIAHLIGHEGPGSILAYLKEKGWASSLSSGAYAICPGTATFNINVSLTEAGLKEYREVVKIIFQYIALLKEQPPQKWVADEKSKLGEIEFKYRQKSPASSTVSRYSTVMQRPYPRAQLLSAGTKTTKYDPEAIVRGWNELRADNFKLSIVSQEWPGNWDRKEKWYGTEYRIDKLAEDFLEEIKHAAQATKAQRPAELFLPGVNEFLPQRLDVDRKEVKEPAKAPKLIRNDANVRTWWKKDDQFWVPKATAEICLRSPLSSVTPLTTVLTQLFEDLVEDSLTEYAYDAELAGLDYRLSGHTQGLTIAVSGYNDKLSVLLERVLISMRDVVIKDERFDVIKERTVRNYKNFDLMDPYQQIANYSHWLVLQKNWAPDEILEELRSVSAEDVREFIPQVLRQMHIEVLVHGNVYKEDALNLTNLVESTLRPKTLPAGQWPMRRNIQLPEGSDHRYVRTLTNPDNINHCIDYLLFVGSNTDRSIRAQLFLFAQMANEPVFDTLRSKEQLGYVVGSHAMVLSAVSCFRVVIQSEKDCSFLDKRIESFFNVFEETIRDMPEEEFEAYKIALINKRLEKLKNLSQETGRFWSHISGETLDFELTYRDAQHIEPLTKEDMLAFFRYYISPNSPSRTKLAVWMVAQSSAADLAAKTSSAEKVEQVAQKGQAALAPLLSKLSLASKDAGAQTEDAVAVNGETKTNGAADTEAKSKTVVIEDVKAFRASMPLTAGVVPVKDYSEFEELEAKL